MLYLFFWFVSITLEYFRKSRFFDVYRSHNNRNSYSSMMSSKHATARRSRTSRKGAIMLVKSTKKVKLDHWQRKQNSHRSPPLLRKLNILISRQEEAVSTQLPRGDRRLHLTASSVCLRSLVSHHSFLHYVSHLLNHLTTFFSSSSQVVHWSAEIQTKVCYPRIDRPTHRPTKQVNSRSLTKLLFRILQNSRKNTAARTVPYLQHMMGRLGIILNSM